MANTFTQIYLQFVFAVQDRISLIRPEWKDELYKYITGIVCRISPNEYIVLTGLDFVGILVCYKYHVPKGTKVIGHREDKDEANPVRDEIFMVIISGIQPKAPLGVQ